MVGMTRLLHTADLHQGLVTHSRPDPTTGLPSALLSTARCWHRACEIAADQGVDVAVLAGDTFHTPNPDASSLNLFADGLRVLEENGIPILIVAGNHDRAAHPSRPSIVELFRDPPGVHVSVRPEIVEIEGVRFATLPSVSRHLLMANRPGISREEADQAVVDGLCRVIDQFRREGADVLVGHWPVQGAVLGNERDIAIISEPVIPLGELEGPWAWVAMGHIHREQGLRVPRPDPVGSALIGAYPGSVDRMNFGEESERKVALEVALEGQGADSIPTAHELPARRFVTLSPTEPDLSRFLEEDPPEIEGAIVRVRMRVSEEDASGLDKARVQRRLYDLGADLAVLELAVARGDRRRAEGVTEALDAADAFDEWLRVKDVPEEDRPALRDLAKRIMEGAE